MGRKILIVLVFFLWMPIWAFCDSDLSPAAGPPFLILTDDYWVNKELEQMTLTDQIAQLIIIDVTGLNGGGHRDRLADLIQANTPGGIVIRKGSAVKTARQINQLQEKSKVPLLVAVEASSGLSGIIDSTAEYPCPTALGAIPGTDNIYQMGLEIGKQMKQMGMHILLSSQASLIPGKGEDVPGMQSFGEDKIVVSRKSWAVTQGLQDAGIASVANYFPGYGEIKSDSSVRFREIPYSKERIDIRESFPFRFLAENGLSGIMTGDVRVPSIDPSSRPAAFSQKIIQGYLREEIGFEGIVVSEVQKQYGQTEGTAGMLDALKAGNDMVVLHTDPGESISSVKQGIERGEISVEEIQEKCRRVLALKRWCGLHIYKPVRTEGLVSGLNSPFYEGTTRKLIKHSLTVLNNQHVLPVGEPGKLKMASVMIGTGDISPFQRMLDRYGRIDHFFIDKMAREKELAMLRKRLDNYELVILGFRGTGYDPSNRYGITGIQKRALVDIIRENSTVVVFFGNVFALRLFENIHHSAGLIMAYQDTPLTQELAAQLVFGANAATGRLPLNVDHRFNLNDGLDVTSNQTLAYTVPEELGISSALLHEKIDAIAQIGLDSSAYPGCQVLVAKDGQVIFHKCYGYHTYAKEQLVQPDNIYDWASLTKVTGPLPALMKLVDEDKIELDAPFSHYWPDFKESDKARMTVREILAHQARLKSWISFWQMAVDDEGRLSKKIFKHMPTDRFNVRVSENLYMDSHFRREMFDTIRNSDLLSRKRYLYSGLSFYLYPDIISNLTGQPYEQYLKSVFYEPLGASTITFNAYQYFPEQWIIPTENDDFFRQEKLRGFVHDEGAAMMGGVSGNAGLFGSINDLAKLFQMFLQKGYYGGKRYISEEVMNEFIRIQFPENKNRRGLGFDKPYIHNHRNRLKDAYPAVDASGNSFGHSGYTGTLAWADPDNGLLFIFLSNRVHPTRENSKLYNLNIRTAMHQAIYDCLKKK